MPYSIGEAARMTGVNISTLRYYDREGLFPKISRTDGGIRIFSDVEMETLQIIECLKMTDMPIKDIKQFLDWCQAGDSTLQQRRDMFYERLDCMNRKMQELQQTINTVKYKCWYYDTALSAGTEEVSKNMSEKDMPEEIQIYKREMMRKK
ncbi:MerR family transcriptional regulator [Synergistaceae bacterium OttesenSCG-928-D05]|nr:MerR family transcriptional regulator [Synergistaceae bacterium OttesenSCG-928-D05]